MSRKSRESNDLGFLPKPGKVPLIASHEIVGAGSVGAFQKDIVIWISRNLRQLRWSNGVGMVFDQLNDL